MFTRASINFPLCEEYKLVTQLGFYKVIRKQGLHKYRTRNATFPATFPGGFSRSRRCVSDAVSMSLSTERYTGASTVVVLSI